MLRRLASRAPHAVFLAAISACVASIVGCASSKNATNAAAQPEHDLTILDSTDLIGHGYSNTLVAVQSARPAWLRVPIGPPAQRDNGRGATNARFPTAAQVARATGDGPTPIGVFLEGSKQQMGMSYLGSTPVESIAQLRHLSASESMSTYGPEWAWGAIVVRLRQ
jgi:hypothetical protein